MQEIVVIDGEIELENTLDGEVELEAITDLDPEVVLNAGGGVTPSGTIEITENGTYNVTEYASADVDVQGGITPTGTKQISITQNGTVTEDVTNYASAEITTNVPASAVDTGTKSINSNGTHDVVGYANASVNVPNSYSSSDEGKVVSNGALVAQTSDTVTANDTYDTTLINSLTVNVSGGGGISVDDIAMGRITGDIVFDSTTTQIKVPFLKGTAITSVTGANITNFNSQASMFDGCTSLATINLPKLDTLNNANYAFRNCDSLQIVNLPKLKNTGGNTFQNCDHLETVVLPYINATVGAYLVGGCTSLTALDITHTGTVRTNNNMANGATNLTAIILRGSSVLSMNNINDVTNTPFASGKAGGTLYVPQSLISSYQSATNWSTILGYSTNSIQAIEGSQYENYYADGTPISS